MKHLNIYNQKIILMIKRQCNICVSQIKKFTKKLSFRLDENSKKCV